MTKSCFGLHFDNFLVPGNFLLVGLNPVVQLCYLLLHPLDLLGDPFVPLGLVYHYLLDGLLSSTIVFLGLLQLHSLLCQHHQVVFLVALHI